MNTKIPAVIFLTGTICSSNAMKDIPSPIDLCNTPRFISQSRPFDSDSDSSYSSDEPSSEEEEEENDFENPMYLYKSTDFCSSQQEPEQSLEENPPDEQEKKGTAISTNFLLNKKQNKLRARQYKKIRFHRYKKRRFERKKNEEQEKEVILLRRASQQRQQRELLEKKAEEYQRKIKQMKHQIRESQKKESELTRKAEIHRKKMAEFAAQENNQQKTIEEKIAELDKENKKNRITSSRVSGSEKIVLHNPLYFIDELQNPRLIEKLNNQAQQLKRKIYNIQKNFNKLKRQKQQSARANRLFFQKPRKKYNIELNKQIAQINGQLSQNTQLDDIQKAKEECELQVKFIKKNGEELRTQKATSKILKEAIAEAIEEQNLEKLIAARHEFRVFDRKLKQLVKNAYIEYIKHCPRDRTFRDQILQDINLAPVDETVYSFEKDNEKRLARYELTHTPKEFEDFYQQELSAYIEQTRDEATDSNLEEESEETSEDSGKDDEEDESTPYFGFSTPDKSTSTMSSYNGKMDDLIHEFEVEKVIELAEYQLTHTMKEYDDFYKQQLNAYVHGKDAERADESSE